MNDNLKILVTGAAGFIGSAVCKKLLERGNNVIGIDNHNDYYDPNIKKARLNETNDASEKKIDLTDKSEKSDKSSMEKNSA